MVWKSKGDGEKRKYDFYYDAANRILRADFGQYTSGTFNQSAGVNYNMKMGDGIDVTTAYDANGNILQMQQWGLKIFASEQIDNMLYSYYANSNKLSSVTEQGNGTVIHKLGDFTDKNTTGNDYGYDKNGNMVTDLNKKINGTTGLEITGSGTIIYNYLNLPQEINVKDDNNESKGKITYTYDAAGNKLKKVTEEYPLSANGNISTTTTTSYIGGAVYETKTDNNPATPDYTDVLQFIGHEEGRIRFNPAAGSVPASFQYDYFIKDHLGNVRMVLTEEIKQDIYPAATLENVTYNGGTAISVEDDYYSVNAANVVNPSAGIPAYQNNNGNPPYNNNPYSNYTANSARLYRLNATSNAITDKAGLGIVLKVMAGDNINIYGKSYHKKPTAGYTLPTNNMVVLDLINAFAGTSLVSSKGVTGSQITGQPGFPSSMSGLVGPQPAQNNNTPKAFINWIVFDEQFKWVSGGFDMVGTAVNTNGTFKNHDLSTIPTIPITKNGYIYVYVSNESQYNVFFDNLQVFHNRGPVLEETHYYPFGLTMKGISSKALAFGGPQNKYKFNGGNELQSNEFDDGSGLEMFDAVNRMYDPQIGRFWQIDELAEANWEWAPYNFAVNNPISFNDPLGLQEGDPNNPKVLPEVVVYSIPKGFWAKQRMYYAIMDQLNRRGGTIDRIENDKLREFMYRFDGITKFRTRVSEMTRESDKAFLEAASWFIPVGWITKLKYVRYAANLFRFKRGVSSYRIWLALSKAERGIVKEAGAILNSPQMATLKAAFEKGVSAEVKVGGRTVIYNPEMAASGFTLHGEGFLLGREAFTSSQELGKTVLHELYRLGTQGTGELAVDLTKAYTNAAFDFAEKAIGLFKF